MPTIHVSAVLISDSEHRALVVRKHGTTRFMQPGGKPEPGETPAQTAARELGEELSLMVSPDDLTPLGQFTADAANEAGFTVVADAFSLHAEPHQARAAAEIAEAIWITPEDTVPLAPLSSEVLLPLLWGTR